MSIWQRLLAAIGRVLSAFFNIRIKLKYVLVLVILLVAGCIGVTYNRMINAVGGKADYDEIPCFRKNRPIYTKRTSDNKRSCLTSPIFRISPPSDKTLAGVISNFGDLSDSPSA